MFFSAYETGNLLYFFTYIKRDLTIPRGDRNRKDQCVNYHYMSYIKVHISYLKKFTFIYCQTVLNFTLDISDGLIINRFTQRDEKQNFAETIYISLELYHKIN